MEEQSPKPIVVKTMTVNKKTGVVHNFFEKMKYMEMGGTIRIGSLRKSNDGWWTFYHNIAGESRMKHISDPKFGILDNSDCPIAGLRVRRLLSVSVYYSCAIIRQRQKLIHRRGNHKENILRVFIGGGLEWHVFVRIIANEDDSTVSWTTLWN